MIGPCGWDARNRPDAWLQRTDLGEPGSYVSIDLGSLGSPRPPRFLRAYQGVGFAWI